MFDLTTYVKKWRIRQLKTVFSTLDTLCTDICKYVTMCPPSPGPNRAKKFPPFPLVNQEIVIADGDCFLRLLTLLNENLGLCLWL